MTGRQILTAAEIRTAEARAIADGTPETMLMERAGAGAAEAIRRFAGPVPALILCGPGNNGGDGYVIAQLLAERGVAVRVVALGEPRSDAARWAARQWRGPVEKLHDAAPAPLLIDALFGTGLTRPLDDAVAAKLGDLAEAARVRVAIDLPSGAASDDGSLLSPAPDYGLTVTFGALKPSHLLQPAARHMGRIAVIDIGVAAKSLLSEISAPQMGQPGPDEHKYTRGYVCVVGGEMTGAAALAASAAARAGAGYVRLLTEQRAANIPASIVQGRGDIADRRIGALLIGPGLGLTGGASVRLSEALEGDRPLVLDADALTLLQIPTRLRDRCAATILTPHAGEFDRLFGQEGGDKVARTRAAAARSGAVVIFKGADTVVASPDGRAAIAPPAPPWLASAGTGDVLAGIVAAMLAQGRDPFRAACDAAWIHGHAAEQAGPYLIADDLVAALPAVLGDCL